MNSHSSCPVLFSVATKTLNGHIRSSVKQRNKVISLQISNFLLNMRSVEDNQFKFFCLLIKHICNSNMVNSLKNGECFKIVHCFNFSITLIRVAWRQLIPFSKYVSLFSKCVFIDPGWKNIPADVLLQAETSCARGTNASAQIKRESSSLEASQAAHKDMEVDRRLDSENSETIEQLSSALHANPHVSIRDSGEKWGFLP